MRTEKSTKNDFLDTLENIVRGVLEDKDATAEQKIQAGNLGIKVVQARYRIGDLDKPKEESFFKRGK